MEENGIFYGRYGTHLPSDTQPRTNYYISPQSYYYHYYFFFVIGFHFDFGEMANVLTFPIRDLIT